MLRFRRLARVNARAGGPQGPSSSDTAPRELRKADPCGYCGSGRRLNGRSSRKRAISRSSAATPANCTGSMREPRRTSARSMKTAVRRSGYVFCRWAIRRSETSCCPRRSLESSESRAHGVARRFAPDGTFRHGRLLPSRLISRKLTPVTNRGRRDRRSTGIPETVLLHTGTG